ncbi:hypothetical protein MJA45_02490 [Paenibacillus aurantius]|uniref:Uncharacterized protein n=1 Tax=Paenibacillus aurantius TaxID=2918900 RepID=A0AA96LDU1_9BACL|nr:hypothetical protein [Paenibacillus aurantius]WNQ11947.1 hypothetical protein MJA45_02490 [Paenibacillus aurantius]
MLTRPRKGLLLAAILAALGLWMVFKNDRPYTSVGSFIKIIDKAHSTDGRESWVMAYDPNSPTPVPFKIVIDNPMVWNLLEKDREYIASYLKKGEGDYHIEQVGLRQDNDTLR